MKFWTPILLCSLLLVYGCRLTKGIDTRKLEPVEINRFDTLMSGWVFADLKGDETDFLVSHDVQTENLNSIYIQDIKGKVISQLNLTRKIRSIKALENERDYGRWLFYSYNDHKTVYFEAVKYTWQTPLQRETKQFESIKRNDSAMGNPNIEYYGQINPEIMADIDGDGSTDLLCRAIDGFTANPRGLVLYDFATGKIKWYYELPCNVNSVLWEDFDGNGSKEIIFSTSAFKNTSSQINSFDDQGGWLAVLSTGGQLLFKEKQFNGFGQITLNAADVDQDGHQEIYAVSSTWGNERQANAATMFHWARQRLMKKKSLDLASTLERYQHQNFMQKMSRANEYRLHLTDKTKGLLVLDENLEPVKHAYHAYTNMIWDIADIDRDGDKEILLQTDDDYLEVVDSQYIRRARIKNPFPEDNVFGMFLVRQGLENPSLIAVGSGREIHYYSYSHQSLFTVLSRMFVTFSPLLVLLLLIYIPLQWIWFRRVIKAPFLGANYLSDGIILMVNPHKILHCNRSAYILAQSSKDPSCKDLSVCFPRLYTALEAFIASKLPIHEITDSLLPDQDLSSYSITMFRLKTTRMSYMIVFHKLHMEHDYVHEKIQWADIARRLSHHVRRHITNIILSLDALGKDADSDRQDYYQIIKDEIEKVRVFTHAFQRFTELKDYDLKLQDIIPSVEHCLTRINLSPEIKLIKSYSLSSVQAFIEPIRFEEAVSNAINNALEAMPQGGTLHVSVRELTAANSPQNHLHILVEIEDTGKGIPAKYMEDIWKPFFTTNQSGTGIGIPESRKIIDSMGGMMDIQSEEGVGTIVSFWLKGIDDE